MSHAVESGIAAIFTRTREKLVALVEAKPTANVLGKTLLCLARCRAVEYKNAIFEFFQTNPNDRDAIRAVAEIGGSDAVDVLVNRIRESNILNRNIITEALARLNFPAAVDCLKELLGDHDRYVRFQAANALFDRGGKVSALALCQYISDPDEWISMTILKLLCKMKEYETIPYLIEHFTKEMDMRRKALMVSFLSMFRSVTLVNVFDEGLRSRDPRLKANSIDAIGELELSSREIEIRLSPFVNDPNNRIRANALLVLARLKAGEILPEIAKMVVSGDQHIRRSAAYIFSQIPPAGNEELIKKLLVDRIDDVKKRAILSLKNFPLEFAQPLLDQMSKDQNRWLRKAAIDVATTFPAFPKGPILRLLRSETTYPNLVACMEFFARHPDEDAGKQIRGRIQDPRRQVVVAAVRALVATQGVQVVETLASQIFNAKDIRAINEFAPFAFQSGSLELFDSLLDKATIVKKPWTNDRFLPALDACLEMLKKTDGLSPALAARMAGLPPAPPRSVAPAPMAEVPVSAPTQASHSGETSPGYEESVSEEQPAVSNDFATGVKMFNLGKYPKAKEAFQAAITENPDLPKAYQYLGLIASEEKNFEEAKFYLERFLQYEPKNLKTNLILGKIYKTQRDWDNACRVLTVVVKASPAPDPKILLRAMRELGLANIFLQNNQEAAEILTSVCEQDQSDSESGFFLATAHFNMGNFPMAKAVAAELVNRLDPGDKMSKMAQSLLVKIDDEVSGGGEPQA